MTNADYEATWEWRRLQDRAERPIGKQEDELLKQKQEQDKFQLQQQQQKQEDELLKQKQEDEKFQLQQQQQKQQGIVSRQCPHRIYDGYFCACGVPYQQCEACGAEVWQIPCMCQEQEGKAHEGKAPYFNVTLFHHLKEPEAESDSDLEVLEGPPEGVHFNY